jgi:hypothetical protein
MANVYKIMDTTGDGRLSWKEIKAGFEAIAPELLTEAMKKTDKKETSNDDDEAGANETEAFFKRICANCDFSGTADSANSNHIHTIDYSDFLIAATKVDDEAKFITYMKNAYEQFFNNEEESIETVTLIDILCGEKEIKDHLVVKLADCIDEDHSNEITAYEFFNFMIKQLGQENVFCPHAIRARLKDTFPHIGQSGTFVSDEEIMLVAHNKVED